MPLSMPIPKQIILSIMLLIQFQSWVIAEEDKPIDKEFNWSLQPTLLIQYNSELDFLASSSLIIGPSFNENKTKFTYGIGPSIDYSKDFMGIGIATGICLSNQSQGAGALGSIQLSITNSLENRDDYLVALKGALTGSSVIGGVMIGYLISDSDKDGPCIGIGVGF